MEENVADALAFGFVFILPLVAFVLSRGPVWRRVRALLEPVLVRLWRSLVQPEEPDEQLLRRWATERLEQLQLDLARVRAILTDDAWMTATRQVANRIAHEHLVRDVSRAQVALAAFGPLGDPVPTSVATPRLTFTPAAPRTVVEVMEFGPSGRWG